MESVSLAGLNYHFDRTLCDQCCVLQGQVTRLPERIKKMNRNREKMTAKYQLKEQEKTFHRTATIPRLFLFSLDVRTEEKPNI